MQDLAHAILVLLDGTLAPVLVAALIVQPARIRLLVQEVVLHVPPALTLDLALARVQTVGPDNTLAQALADVQRVLRERIQMRYRVHCVPLVHTVWLA